MPWVRAGEIRLYYELRGSGPRLLYLSGTQSDLRRRPNIFDSALGEAFEILAFDPRGLGQSDRPDVPYSMADYAADAAALLDHVGWSSCVVLGVSFGGMVGQELALRYRERVERLALAATSSGGAGGDSYPLHELYERSLDDQARTWIELGDTHYDRAWQAAHPRDFRAFIEMAKMNLTFAADEPGRAVGARRQLAARKTHNTWDRLAALDLPVFVCGGSRDGLAPIALQQALASRIPSAVLKIFEGGHNFLAQDLEAYAEIASFLGSRP